MRPNSSFSHVFQFVLPWQNVPVIRRAADKVACRCRAILGDRALQSTADMTLAEIRGYVRAQTSGFIDAEVDQSMGSIRLGAALRSRITDGAIDRLAAMIVAEAAESEVATDRRILAA
jgi:hypothetical protein